MSLMARFWDGARAQWIAVCGLVVVQALVLGWMVWDNESVLRTGREVVLDVEPVDPRSLFRGDYVILNYKDLSRLSPPVFSQAMADKLTSGKSRMKVGSRIAVILAQDDGSKRWRAVRTVDVCPKPGLAREACLMGTVLRVGGTGANWGASIGFGLENYFVPEGAGRELEDLIKISRLQVVVAVDRAGRGRIKGLVVDGTRVGNEGLF